MSDKKTILLLTSSDECAPLSQKLVESIETVSNFNVARLGEKNYGIVSRFLPFRYNGKAVGAYFSSDKFKKTEKTKVDVYKRASVRIRNAIKRFEPVAIVALTPYAHFASMLAKNKFGLSVPLIFVSGDFLSSEIKFDLHTDKIVVGNDMFKDVLLDGGFDSHNVSVCPMPFVAVESDGASKDELKEKFGLSEGKTVLVRISDKKRQEKILGFLADQGEILSLVVFGSEKRAGDLKNKVEELGNTTAIFVSDKSEFEQYIHACDILVTDFDRPTILKAFSAGLPVVGIYNNSSEKENLRFLKSQELLTYIDSDIEIVDKFYRIANDNSSDSMSANAIEWVKDNSYDSLAQEIARLATQFAQNLDEDSAELDAQNKDRTE